MIINSVADCEFKIRKIIKKLYVKPGSHLAVRHGPFVIKTDLHAAEVAVPGEVVKLVYVHPVPFVSHDVIQEPVYAWRLDSAKKRPY